MGEHRIVLCASSIAPSDVSDYVRAMQDIPLWVDWNIHHIATHRAGSTATKVATFARGTALFAFRVMRSHPDLVHLHAVGKLGSFSRNAILAWISRLARVPVVFHIHWSTFPVLYRNSSRVVRAMIRATLNAVDAVAVLDGASADGVRAAAPSARVVTVTGVADLDALYRTVTR
jgi:hypothetical protein